MFALFARHWWVLALRGVLVLLFGMLALLLPHFTLIFLVVLFGVYVVLDGLSSGLSALLATWEKPSHRVFLGVEGAVGLTVGVLTLLWPAATAAVFFTLLVVWALLGGSIILLSALRLHRSLQGEVVLVLSGLSALAFGVLLLLFPRAGTLAIAWLIGLYALLAGTLLLVRAFRLRRRMKHHRHWTPSQGLARGEVRGPEGADGQTESIPLEQHV
jgi:uncharacterized membrane protein HdeD (DUF308 family)